MNILCVYSSHFKSFISPLGRWVIRCIVETLRATDYLEDLSSTRGHFSATIDLLVSNPQNNCDSGGGV